MDTFITICIFIAKYWVAFALIPLIGPPMGFRLTKLSIVSGWISGTITAILWALFIQQHIHLDPGVPGSIINILTFLFINDYQCRHETSRLLAINEDLMDKALRDRKL